MATTARDGIVIAFPKKPQSPADRLSIAVDLCCCLIGEVLEDYPDLLGRLDIVPINQVVGRVTGTRADFEAWRMVLIDMHAGDPEARVHLETALNDDLGDLGNINLALGRDRNDLRPNPDARPVAVKTDKLAKPKSWTPAPPTDQPCDLQGLEDEGGFVLNP